jgi:hypothetical protein
MPLAAVAGAGSAESDQSSGKGGAVEGLADVGSQAVVEASVAQTQPIAKEWSAGLVGLVT